MLLGQLALVLGLARPATACCCASAISFAPSFTTASAAIRPATTTEAIVAPTSTAVSMPPRIAIAGLRRAQRRYRSAAPTRRARIGSSSRNRRRSSAIASAEA